ncbi:hypothetical protein [Persicitalea jodogahamensis]|uniref:Uncharacterized protein n=1 Tax=Persicitalea jodogahamensis TaxID=402147 RepID=A0A8J3D5R8_9BACT|nr:hypothetical protein [Persicitalea jodogahamensis]GHB63926.1 hypothetical protein GCM10007390_17220 [Persicitalea jodogahamensis]
MDTKTTTTPYAFSYAEIRLMHTMILLAKQKYKMGPGTHMGSAESKVHALSMLKEGSHQLHLQEGERTALRIIMDDYVTGMVDFLLILENDIDFKHQRGDCDAWLAAVELYGNRLQGAIENYRLATQIKFTLSH